LTIILSAIIIACRHESVKEKGASLVTKELPKAASCHAKRYLKAAEVKIWFGDFDTESLQWLSGTESCG
jgi:hypothetical protein